MQTQSHYEKSPITEALIQLRVELPSEISMESLKSLHSTIGSDYPGLEEVKLIELQGEIQFTSSNSTLAHQQQQLGYRFVSADHRQILQAQADGFTFSRLAPYESWDRFRNEARRLWQFYQSVAQSKTVTRVAVRYINRLDLPLPLRDFKDYLRTLPEVSYDMSQMLAGYFMQLQLPQEDLAAMLVLNQAMLPQTEEDKIPILLDIDLFCETDVSADGEEPWNLLELMRVRKNEIFEACITNNTRKLIK